MEKVTIHRALAELKLIGAKIDKGIVELDPIGIMQKDKPVNGVYQKEDFEKTVKEKFQSLTDLIDRRSKIKSAIVRANADTRVKIAGEEMSISDAITLKNTIESKKKLIEVLKRKTNAAKTSLEKSNAQIEANALELTKVVLSKQSVKVSEDDVKKVAEPYLVDNKFHMVDPIKAEERALELEKKVGDFEAEVDAVLSEINATTTIEF